MTDTYDPPDPIWLISLRVSVVEAALLIINIEPQGLSQYIEEWGDEKKPKGYLAARQAIVSAVQKEIITGSINNHEFEDPNGRYQTDPLKFDYCESFVDLGELRDWLMRRGYKEGFLYSPEIDKFGFRDPSHPRYSSKLAATVEAWEQYDTESTVNGTVKQRLAIWFRLNAAEFELTDADGKPSETVVAELAKVANWATSGGAPKQTNDEPDAD